MDDRRIARALAGTEGPDAAERARRRWARWRVILRTVAVLCVIAGAALAGMLLWPMPRQAELQYTQGQVRDAGWDAAPRRPRFTLSLEHGARVFEIDHQLAERGGRKLADIVKPGATARVGYTSATPLVGNRWHAWDLAVDGRAVYSLGDARARAARRAPPWWFLTSVLLGAGVILWFVTPPQRRAHRHRRRQGKT